MKCDRIRITRHALQRMFDRGISPEDVRAVLMNGEAVEMYPDDKPYPSMLLLSRVGGRPLHVVVAQDAAVGDCFVVTVYEPDATLWHEDFKKRR